MTPVRGLGPILLAALAMPLPLQSAVGQEPQSAEQAILQVQFGRLLGTTLPALRAEHNDGPLALLPMTTFLELAEIRYRLSPDGVLAFRREPQQIDVTVAAGSGTLRIGKENIPVQPSQIVWQAGELYLDAHLVARALQVAVNVDWTDLQVTVLNPETLPVGRRLARERLRRVWRDGQNGVAPDLALALERPNVSGLVMDYSLLAPSENLLHGSFTAGIGVGVLGGSMEMNLASRPEGGVRPDLAWSGVWRANRWLTQLHLGDAVATGPRPRSSRGVAITNAPYLRAPGIGSLPYTGVLGPGWQVEAYRGGRLIAFDSVNALGAFSIDVPIQYGENPVDFVAYGPFGEIREFNRTYRVRRDQLPTNRFEYGVSLGACRTVQCQASANLDARYGLGPRWSIQAGVDQFWRDSLPDLVHPYASITGGFGNAFSVRGEMVANAVTRGALNYEPSTELQISAEYTQFAKGTIAPILTPDGRRSQWTLQTFFRPVARWEAVYVDGSVDHITSDAGVTTSGRVGVSAQLAETRILPALRVERQSFVGSNTTSRSILSLNTLTLPRPSLGAFLGQLTTRTNIEVEGLNRLLASSIFLSRNFRRGWRVEAGVAWRQTIGTSFNMILATEVPGLRSYNTATTESGTLTGSHFIQGSMQVRSAAEIDFATTPSVQRAGVAGRVFVDTNGNGVFDSDEEAIPNARVRVGIWSTRTDQRGNYRIWDLTPYEPTLVAVDSLSLPSPLWMPAYASISVEAAPNSYRALDLPVTPGGVVDGRVLRPTPTGVVGVAGVPLQLRNQATGGTYQLLTFSDGSFYAMGVRPGIYDVVVSQAALARLGATAPPMTFTIRPSVDGESIAGLDLTLLPIAP